MLQEECYAGVDHVLREKDSIRLVMMQSAPGLALIPEQIRGVEVGVDAGPATCFPTLNLMPGRPACISAASSKDSLFLSFFLFFCLVSAELLVMSSSACSVSFLYCWKLNLVAEAIVFTRLGV